MVAKKKAAAAKAVAESEAMAEEAARGAPENDTATAGDWNAAAPAQEPAGEYDPYNAREPLSAEERAVPDEPELPMESVPAKDADGEQIPSEATEELEPQPQGGALKRTRKAQPIPVDMTGNNSGKVVLSYCERIERLMEEMSTYKDDIKEVFGELKGAGFDVATVRKLLRRRAMDPDKRAEQDALLDIYESAVQNAESSR